MTVTTMHVSFIASLALLAISLLGTGLEDTGILAGFFVVSCALITFFTYIYYL
jgi:hypothetical protein